MLHLLFVEIRLRLYGSSCTKFGFKDSDVNIDIQYPSHVSDLFIGFLTNLSGGETEQLLFT